MRVAQKTLNNSEKQEYPALNTHKLLLFLVVRQFAPDNENTYLSTS